MADHKKEKSLIEKLEKKNWLTNTNLLLLPKFSPVHGTYSIPHGTTYV